MVQAICIVGYSGSGKTTIIEKLIPLLRQKGYRIGTIKHSRHDVETDKPGKDSHRHRSAGAEAVILAGPGLVNLVRKMDQPDIEDLLPYLQDLDLVIVEGYKNSTHPKIMVMPPDDLETGSIPNKTLAAIIGQSPDNSGLPCFERNDIEGLAEFIVQRFLKPPN